MLDPTRDAWGQHFLVSNDRLMPVPGDADAEYTYQVYDLDDPRKVARRRARRELVSDCLPLAAHLDEEASAVLSGIADLLRRRDWRRFAGALRKLRSIHAQARRLLAELERYAAIPADAPRTCRCPAPADHSLPEELGRQVLEVPDAPAAASRPRQ